jgi:hypothetical protein
MPIEDFPIEDFPIEDLPIEDLPINDNKGSPEQQMAKKGDQRTLIVDGMPQSSLTHCPVHSCCWFTGFAAVLEAPLEDAPLCDSSREISTSV